ncbi:hypothetical protein CHU32_19335 [Superficieibacter electus]|uniref:Uncharacterized protein n=1 Tax=Superficieibacter electus TaxID=2022662 RepID=A0A2P5GLF7_9ENTR|nr:hypothetical protein CHU33_18960 [Superficieibacter electus]POP45795.1 hypothetical protein CHU32_19335 [Superficieibacter electus]
MLLMRGLSICEVVSCLFMPGCNIANFSGSSLQTRENGFLSGKGEIFSFNLFLIKNNNILLNRWLAQKLGHKKILCLSHKL